MSDYVFVDTECDDDTVRCYPRDKPYVMRDQGLRAADDMMRVVIGDVADVLEAAGFTAEALKAQNLYNEANGLAWDDNGNWTDHTVDDCASEKLHWILEEAENLDHVYVSWNGDCGTVWITISDEWVEVDAESDEGKELIDVN